VGLPVFFPSPRYVKSIDTMDAVPLYVLCERAGVECQGLGAWIARPIVIRFSDTFSIEAMPGYASPVVNRPGFLGGSEP
jgi:hypothetical protein